VLGRRVGGVVFVVCHEGLGYEMNHLAALLMLQSLLSAGCSFLQ
jgi:hypothetical protein